MPRLVHVRSPIDLIRLRRLDSQATVLTLGSVALSSFDDRMLELLVLRRSMVVALGEGSLDGGAAAAAVLSDFFALRESATLDVSGEHFADLLSAAFWRIRHRAVRLLLNETLSAPAAVRLGLADALVPDAEDSVKWLEGWLRRRSLMALQSAAALIRRDRGTVDERVEFARIFAAGEPRRGLGMFLEKRPPDFSENVIVETI